MRVTYLVGIFANYGASLTPVEFTTDTLNFVTTLWIGETTTSYSMASATIDDSVNSVRYVVSETDTFETVLHSSAVTPHATYHMARATVSGLTPNTEYYAAFACDGVIDLASVGQFKTPAVGAHSFSFSAGTCSRFNTATVYDFIAANGTDLFVHIGDIHYDNLTENDEQLYHDSWNGTAFGNAARRAAWKARPFYWIWDDHDYSDNNSGKLTPSRPAAMDFFRRRNPVTLAGPQATYDDAIYYTFKIGRVRFIMTDNRSQKIQPSDEPQGPKRTMLGEAQKQWLFDLLLDPANEGDFFIWANSLPWIGGTSNSADWWSGHSHERTQIANFIRRHGLQNRMFIVSGDMHSMAYDDGTNSDYAIYGGAPLRVYQCAPISNSNSIKGGPWSSGDPIEENSLYGVFEVTDTGGDTITIDFDGRYVSNSEVTETTVLSDQFTLTLVAPDPLPTLPNAIHAVGGVTEGANAGRTDDLEWVTRKFDAQRMPTALVGAEVDTQLDRFTLPAGDFMLSLQAGMYTGDGNRLYLYDVTNDEVVYTSVNMNRRDGQSTARPLQGRLILELTEPTTYEVRTRAEVGGNSGLGRAADQPNVDELYVVLTVVDLEAIP
jgi:hypothetical protein